MGGYKTIWGKRMRYKNYKAYFIATLLMLGLGVSIEAVPYYREITSVGTSAEMMGIGNVQGFSHQASVLLESPAGLGYAENSFSGFYTSYFGGTRYMTSAISYTLFPELTLGFAGAYEWTDGLDFTGENSSGEAFLDDSFTASTGQVVLGLEFRPVEKLHLGASLTEYVSKLYDVHGTGSDMSLGLRYETTLGDVLFNGKNILGRKVHFNDETSEKLSSQWSIGYKSSPLPVMDSELYAQIKQIRGIASTARSVGIRMYPMKSKVLAVSLGYKEKPGVSDLKGTMTAGVGLNMGTFSLQYGYDTTDVYQNTQQHYVSISVKY